jgi:hypothetical protein
MKRRQNSCPIPNVGVFGYRRRVCPDLLHKGNTHQYGLGFIRLALQPSSIRQPIVHPAASLSSERTEEGGDNQNRGPTEDYY